MNIKPIKQATPVSINNLYKAVQDYVNDNGGDLLVVGGVEIQEWPEEGKLNFRVAIKCMGKKPNFVAPTPTAKGG